MLKVKTILIITAIAVVLAGLSLFFKSDATLANSDAYTSGVSANYGFPFHFYESHYTDREHQHWLYNSFLYFWFFLNILFYGLVAWSVYYLFNFGLKRKKWFLLILTALLAVFWFVDDISQTTDQCIAGFPIQFYAHCADDFGITASLILYGIVLDSLFWFSLAFMFIAVLHFLSSGKIGRWQYLIAPVFATLIGFFNYTPCGGWFCIFTGRGFPIAFYSHAVWDWTLFGFDFLIWALFLYPIIRWIVRVLAEF